MTYSEDLRNRARALIAQGYKPKVVSELLNVTTRSIYNWVHCSEPSKKPGRKGSYKFKDADLLADIKRYPDDYIHERAKRFNMSKSGMHHAMKRLGISKKNTKVRST